jgi:hypothetical protein
MNYLAASFEELTCLPPDLFAKQKPWLLALTLESLHKKITSKIEGFLAHILSSLVSPSLGGKRNYSAIERKRLCNRAVVIFLFTANHAIFSAYDLFLNIDINHSG